MGISVLSALSPNIILMFGCSNEPSHRDGSFEHPQHMFWLKDKKKDNFNTQNFG